jgi:hypothetical protein
LLSLIRQWWCIEYEWHWVSDSQIVLEPHRYANRNVATVLFLCTVVMYLVRCGGYRSIR